jgi:nicotinate (nicotinamide) nucleotide adenylyltransferase
MEFFRRAAGRPRRLGIFPGAFNPPTRAHLALAEAALDRLDEVVFVLPRVFPHKPYEGAPFTERVKMLERAAAGAARYSIAAAERGLFIEIARECRRDYGESAALAILCGRDAAERIVTWDYGGAGTIEQMLDEFELLVAARGCEYAPPAHLASRISVLPISAEFSEVSASEVRRRAARGEPWEHLVPPQVVDDVRRLWG